ncbi:MAG: Sporulation kinase E [Verrucomicrobia bacterium ADurb.Bin345]|nr:MAG: Sporulation kinase E [Verrucomicrobia bacterium ADurb.Bin345]
MKSAFLDKLIERLDRLDPGSLQSQFLRLAQEKGFLETVFHAFREGVIVVNEKGRISYANTAAQKLLGFSMDAAAGQPIERYLREVEWDRVLALDEREWSKLVTREIEVSYPEHRFLDFYVVPLPGRAAEPEGAVIILRDITREREQEAKTIESERLNALTLLAAGVAHEIGNPLNSLNIHLQLIERELADLPADKEQSLRELLDVSRREVSRLDQIISQFLRAIRPSLPTFEKASVSALLKETLEFLKHEIRDRDVLVEVSEPEENLSILLDPNQIKQVFFNIIRNAIQAMPDGGLLKIAVTDSDRYVAVSFRDTGPGIAPEDLGRIFEPYHSSKAEGSGLGLMIVQRIIREHGGQIEVHSEPRKGTTFTIFLPRDEHRVRLLKAHKARATSAGVKE